MTRRPAQDTIWLGVFLWSLAHTNQALAQGSAVQSATWTTVMAPSSAIARAAHVFVYDEARENCVVFGGRPVDDHGTSLDDTGIWSGSTWVPVAARYGFRGDVTGAFDSRRQVTVVYGGTDGLSFFADTWEFDGSGWTRRMGVSPGILRGNGLAYDSRRNVTVLFGGYNGPVWKDELWEWDGSTWTRSCREEPCSVAPRPAARAHGAFVYDGARGVTLLFGGGRDGQTFDDTWSWDGERWQELHSAHVPPARASAAATYDPVSKQVLLFGGLAAGLQELNDFWAWDGQDWTPISQASAPFARHGAGMAWQTKDRRGILFGGSAGGKETDAREFKLFGTACTTSEDCHVGNCVQGRCPSGPDVAGMGGGASGGDSGGGASGGSSGDSGMDEGGGGQETTPSGGTLSDAGRPPASSGPITVDLGTAAAGSVTSSSSTREAPPARSFYSCALPATSRFSQAPLLYLAVLAAWFSRRRSAARATP